MNKQPEVTDATREALVTAFFQLARKKRIHQITVREIINSAGYSRATFYRYFKDVYALIEYAEDVFFQNTREILEEYGEESGAYDRHFFEIFLNCFRENKERLAVLMSEQNRSHFTRRMMEKTIDNIDTHIADTPKKMLVTDMFFSSIFSAVGTHLLSPKALSNEDLLDVIQKMFSDWYWPQMTEETDQKY